MDNSHSGLVIQQTNICSNFHCQLNNIWLRYNKKAKGMFFYETRCIRTHHVLRHFKCLSIRSCPFEAFLIVCIVFLHTGILLSRRLFQPEFLYFSVGFICSFFLNFNLASKPLVSIVMLIATYKYDRQIHGQIIFFQRHVVEKLENVFKCVFIC